MWFRHKAWVRPPSLLLTLGAAIVAQVQGKPQFNQWFTYVLLAFVICTLLVEIVYLNVCPLLEPTDNVESAEYFQCNVFLGFANFYPDEYSDSNRMIFL